MNKKHKTLIFMLASLMMLPLIFVSCAKPSINIEIKKVQASMNTKDLGGI